MKATGNALLDMVQELAGGALAADLHTQITELVGQVRSTNKKGAIHLSITVSMAKGGNALVIDHDVKVKAPKIDREMTVMFADDNNRLTRHDPRQPRLPELAGPVDARAFRAVIAVNERTGEIRE